MNKISIMILTNKKKIMNLRIACYHKMTTGTWYTLISLSESRSSFNSVQDLSEEPIIWTWQFERESWSQSWLTALATVFQNNSYRQLMTKALLTFVIAFILSRESPILRIGFWERTAWETNIYPKNQLKFQ